MKRSNFFSVEKHTVTKSRCGLIFMILMSVVCLSSCLDEGTTDETNYVSITVQTKAATSITAYSATLNAVCSAPQNRTFTRGICAGTTKEPTIYDTNFYKYS